MNPDGLLVIVDNTCETCAGNTNCTNFGVVFALLSLP